MALTTTAAGSKVQQWERAYFAEYTRATQLSKLMGKSINNPIQTKKQKEGLLINMPLITRLTNTAILDDNTLEGNEEALGNYNHQLTARQRRWAVRVPKMEQAATVVDYADAAKEQLKAKGMDDLRDTVLTALRSANVDGKTAYASCSEANKDAWLTANSDRVLVGALKSNTSTLDHSTSLANCDATNDILQPAIVSLAKRMAKVADPHIRPVTVDEQGEWYVLLASTYCFRDLKNHATMVAAHDYAAQRGKDNPLFTDGDLMWDGVIIKEIPEIAVITGVGAGAIDVAPNFLLGAQAVGLGWVETSHIVEDEFDYGNQHGIGIAEVRGTEKLIFNSKQHGLLTLYCAAVADV